jgi:DNA polymerase I-like protein with 3'-5' exonuclease and polymerase domains
VKKLADKLQAKGKRGWFSNAFGYRLVFDTSSEFDSTHKACNYLIQSSVSGLLHMFISYLIEQCALFNVPFIFVTVIHDEVVLECPRDKVDLLRQAKEAAVAKLNQVLNWSVPIGMGFSVGENFYEAK